MQTGVNNISKLFLLLLVFTTSALFSQNKVVITIDDLPFQRSTGFTEQELLNMNQRMITSLQKNLVPAAVFINAQKLTLQEQSEPIPERIHSLEIWAENGFLIGNHT